MWVYFKKDEVGIDFSTIRYFFFGDNQVHLYTDVEGDSAISAAVRDQDVFIEVIKGGLARKAPLVVWDDSKPRFQMRLSGREEDDGEETEGVDFDSM